MKRLFRILVLITPLSLHRCRGSTLESVAKSVLSSVIDYDSRAYLALAREKEAKRRARFEATRLRLMQEDMEIALAGSQITLSIARTLLHMVSLLFDPKSLWAALTNAGQHGLVGNLGFAFLVGWSTNKLYHIGKQWWPSIRPQTAVRSDHKPMRMLIENCQRRSHGYTKKQMLTILRSLTYAGVSHGQKDITRNT